MSIARPRGEARENPTGRSAEFGHGATTHHQNDAHFGVNPFVEARYGDKKQLPAPPERRAGPLPYPQTYHEYLDEQYEKKWSQSDWND